MTSLIRTKQGNISIKDTNKLEDIRNNNFTIHKIEEVLEYPKIELDEDNYKKIKNGMKIPNSFNIKDKVIFTYQNKIIGIYEKDNNILKVWKNFT